jgi:Kef-type K+ transport system membrane component KefB
LASADIVGSAISVGLLLLAAKLGEEVAERAGFPGILGSILAGLILGEAITGVLSLEELGSGLLLLSIGINFTLFLAGVEELSSPSLLVPRKRDAVLALAVLALSALPVVLALQLLTDLSLQSAAGLAVVMAMVSVGPLMKILLSAGSLGEREFRILRAGLLVELVGLVLFNTLVQKPSFLMFAESAFFVTFIYFFGRRYLDDLLVLIERHIRVREAPFAFIVALVIMAGYIAEVMSFNAAVTALMLGVMLSEYMGKRPLYLERIRALTFGFLEPLFFAGIGVYAARPSILSLYNAALLALLSGAPKVLLAKSLGYGWRSGVALLAKGGVDAALVLSLLGRGLIDGQLYTSAVLALVASSLAASASYRVQIRHVERHRASLSDIELPRVIVREDASAEYAAEVVAKVGAAVVVDSNGRPRGYIVAEDFVGVDPYQLSRIPLRFFMRTDLAVVSFRSTILDVISDPALIRMPIVVVVDDDGIVVGTLTPRMLLELLVEKRGVVAGEKSS